MNTQHPVKTLLVRLMLIVSIVVPYLAKPSLASAHAASAVSLVQGRNETLDAYLQRVAKVNPPVFQQASLAAVQDAFNGKLPKSMGEHAMEAQIAYYLHLAATGSDMQTAATHTGSSSAVLDDAYLWNGTRTDKTGDTNSSWQLTARPGGDTASFAKSMQKMLTPNALPLGLPDTTTRAPQASSVSPLPQQSTTSSDTTPAVVSAPSVPVQPVAAPVAISAPLPEKAVPQIKLDSDAFEQAVTRHAVRDIDQDATHSNSYAAVTKPSADLGLKFTTQGTAKYGDVITYRVVITNYGPATTPNGNMIQTLPADGVLKSPVTNCTSTNDRTLNCIVGALDATQTVTISVPVEMKGNGPVTSSALVRDLGGTIDPGVHPVKASVVTTITTPGRTARVVGNVVIAANSFQTVGGRVQASQAVTIGFVKADKTNAYFLKLGPDDTLSWQDGSTAITGKGTVAQILNNFALFTGDFTIDASQTVPKIVPGNGAKAKVAQIAGFKVVGDATIGNVYVITGTAQLAATFLISQTTLLTSSQQQLQGEAAPGGVVQATIPAFEMSIAGLAVKVTDATFSKDRIVLKQAEVTMPEALGKSTGIISEIIITSNTITFGGLGVKVPIPPIYPVGKPITGTNAFTPTLAFVDNSATLWIINRRYGLQINSTLQLSLPGNSQNISAQLAVDAMGNLIGRVDQFTLSIAGQRLTAKNIRVTNDGLNVKIATLTITTSTTKAPESAAQPLSENVLTVAVKQLSISKDGLALGSVAITNTLPNISIGETATFSDLSFTLALNDPTNNPSFELDIKGKLKINLKDNEQDIAISAKIDKDGKFSGKIDELTLTIAKSQLVLKDVTFSSQRFTAGSATLSLPAFLSSTTVAINEVVIDEKGISFGDASVKIPIEFTVGKEGDPGTSTNSIAVKGELSLILAVDRTYGFAVEGEVKIKLASQSASAKGSFRMDSTGEMRGTIDSFELTIAGMTLAVKAASVEGSALKADEATFSIPEAWGGLSASVYGVQISKEGFSISGGSFKLPEIKVGDMRIALEGTLKEENGNWIIAAAGTLELPNMAGGCGGVGVSVELATDGVQNTVMTLAPLDATSPEAIKLRNASVSLKCNIVLGTSGFELTAISGTVTLEDNSTKLNVSATIESQLSVGSFKALTANGDMTIDYVRDPYKFEIGIGASMKIFSMFEAARASASMTFANGPVPFIFRAELNIDAVIARGNVKLTAWTSNGDFHLVGRIYGSVGLREGALLKECVDTFIFGEACITVPPTDLFIDATMEFGEFKLGDSSTWGLKATVNILGADYGVYVDTDGNF